MNKKNSVLYLSYTGLLEPLGQSQILNYLLQLSNEFKIILITYEKPDDLKNDFKIKSMKKKLKRNNIEWYSLKYHKKPSVISTIYDLVIGIILILKLMKKNKIKIIHARSYVVSTIAIFFKKIFGVKYIFDMRGFWVDERVSSGQWKVNSFIYKIGKFLEKSFINNSDIVVSLTQAAVKEMKSWEGIKDDFNYEIIPTCVDLNSFNIKDLDKNIKRKFSIEDKLIVGYVGSVGGWQLFDKVLEYFNMISQVNNNAHLFILNKGQHKYIKKSLNDYKIKDYSLLEVDFKEVPRYINLFDLAIFFNKPGLGREASAPTRFGEFLACGIPVISNSGFGDIEKIITQNNVGEVIKKFGYDEYQKTFYNLLKKMEKTNLKNKCRSVANRKFSLKKGVEKYRDIYISLM